METVQTRENVELLEVDASEALIAFLRAVDNDVFVFEGPKVVLELFSVGTVALHLQLTDYE